MAFGAEIANYAYLDIVFSTQPRRLRGFLLTAPVAGEEFCSDVILMIKRKFVATFRTDVVFDESELIVFKFGFLHLFQLAASHQPLHFLCASLLFP